MRPNYLINIGSEKFSRENGSDVVSIRVIRTIGLPTDSCEVSLVGGKDYSFERDDKVKVQLGYDEKLMPVFSGFVNNIIHGIATMSLTALGLTRDLLRLRLNNVYLHMTAGDIVQLLAQEVSLKVDASPGIRLPTYVVDYAANAYEHILRLAERCDFDVYVTDDEQLVFKEWNGGKKHSLEYGKDIIRVEGVLDYSPLFASARVYGESPASVKGSDTFHWLTKREVKGEAGSGLALTLHDPTIKDKQTADTVANAVLSKLKYNLTAVVETVGKPEIKLGDTVAITGMSNSAIQGELEVRGIEYYLSKVKGFTTRISCWMKG